MPPRSRVLTLLVFTALAFSISAFAQTSDKMDEELQKALERVSPDEPIAIIVVFRDQPTEEQVDILKREHRMEIAYVYKIIAGVAGKAPAGEIPRIAGYDWVKEIWLDRRVYATGNKSVETSQLIDELQREGEELRQTISNLSQEITGLREQVQALGDTISQLETSLKIYPTVAFVAGLAVGIAAGLAVKARRESART